jgi:hypothetical protein
VRCHGADKQRGGLRLDDGAPALRGCNSGAVLEPGDSAHSRLLVLVAGLDAETKMPPGKGKALRAAEVGLLRAWIDQGAPWPKASPVPKTGVRSKHWAFQPVRRPPVSAVAGRGWLRDGIDAFAANCLLARRQVERGVRFVNLYHASWNVVEGAVHPAGQSLRSTSRGSWYHGEGA